MLSTGPRATFCGLVALAFIACRPTKASEFTAPATVEPVDISVVQTVEVHDAAEFQQAVSKASPGTLILLDSTRTFGPIFIPDDKHGLVVKPTAESVVIECGPYVADETEKPALTVGLRCSQLSFQNLVFQSVNPGTDYIQYTLVRCGYTADNAREAQQVDELPHHIEFVNCEFLGTEKGNNRIGLLGNACHLTVRGCTIREIHEIGEDSQGILVNNTPGPLLIEKCDIEAAGENIMLGGSVATIPGLLLGDLTCVDNLLSKPLSWKESPWQVKNLFELKGCERAHVARNKMQNCWTAAQDGTAVLFTVRDESHLDDILFEDNLIENIANGLLLSSTDDPHKPRYPRPTGRIMLRGNTWLGVGAHAKADGQVYNLVSPDGQMLEELIIDGDRWAHHAARANSFLAFEGTPKSAQRIKIVNCIGSQGRYGIIGAGTTTGLPTIQTWVQTFEFRGNQLVNGPSPALYGPYGRQNRFTRR